MGETLIKVEGVSKKYCRSLKKSLWYGLQDIGREISGACDGGLGELRDDEFWAVKDLSFELNRGECLGLIGRNGAGKTTLLKLLNGLIKPDQGRIELRGKVGALISLGAGFNPILTGRENIRINASVLGLENRSIDKKLDEIIDFAEIGKFIDSPVQNYSSGMQVRLGFAVASFLEPDILLLDEVMAVGDMAFVLKCFNRMDKLLKNTAVIFVSHNMPQVSRVASEIVLMDKGEAIYQERDVAEGIDKYYSMYKPIPSVNLADNVSLEKVSINNNTYNGDPISIKRLDDMHIETHFEVDKKYKNLAMFLAFYDIEQRNIAEFVEDEPSVLVNNTGAIHVAVTLPKINFSKGVYSVTVGLRDVDENQVLLRSQSAAFFQVIAKKNVWSAFQLNGRLEQLS